eukprot:scaffold1904_cov375-Prasinococcus_capsulatus_cf.AAC.4
MNSSTPPEPNPSPSAGGCASKTASLNFRKRRCWCSRCSWTVDVRGLCPPLSAPSEAVGS